MYLFSGQRRFRVAPNLLALAVFVGLPGFVLLLLLALLVLLAEGLSSPPPWDPALEPLFMIVARP